MRAGAPAEALLSLATSFCLWGQGPVEAGGGSPRPEARKGPCRKVKGKKKEGDGRWKSGGGRTSSYTWQSVGLADEAGSDAIPDAAGGEGVSGRLDRKA
jgi:hypothetical protein